MTTSDLSRAYVGLLAWYSPEWRAEHGDAMLGTLLDRADAESRTHVSLAERAELITGGLRERLLGPRHLALPNVIALSAATVVSFADSSVRRSPGLPLAGFAEPFSNPSVVTAALIVGAFLCMMLSRPVLARILSLASVVVEVTVGVLGHTFDWFGTSWGTVALFAALALLAALPMRRTTTAVTATAAVGIVVTAAVFVPIAVHLSSDFFFWSLVTLLSIVILTGIACAATRARVRRHSISGTDQTETGLRD
ncbi:hypothetical protein [Leifsonia sp. NPDC058230]|uniref:hypothetical protein n=1 Tax=Leifsonia sp. NPDC058230 TaxID=3346391 RepID=UPI0036D86AA4